MASHAATFRVLQHLRLYTFSRILPPSPGAIARFRQVELLNCLVADVDTLDHLYLRVISPLAVTAGYIQTDWSSQRQHATLPAFIRLSAFPTAACGA